MKISTIKIKEISPRGKELTRDKIIINGQIIEQVIHFHYDTGYDKN